MKQEVKKLPKNQVQIIVELTPAELKPFLEQAAKDLAKNLDIAGFRPGKAPFDLVKEKVGENKLYQEAAQKAMEKTYPEVCQQEKLLTVASPKVEIVKLAPNNPLIYKAIVPLLPKIKIGDYHQLKAKRKPVEVEEKQVDKVLQDLRQMRAQEKVVLRPAKSGDKVEVDFQIFMDKVPIEGGQGKKVSIIIGEGYFIPGFEDQLVSMSAGQEKKFQLTFPKNYHQKNLANRPADFQVKVHNVYQRDLPELNDEFAKKVGNKFKNFPELKDQLSKNLQQEEETKENQRLELEILREIIGKSEFEEIPEVLLESELDKMIAELQGEIQKRNLKFEDYLKSIKKTTEELREEFSGKAEERVKTALITREIAEKENIEVKEEEVAQEIQKTLDLYQGNDEVKKKLATPQYFSYVKNVMTNRKVFEFLNKQTQDK